MTGLVDIQVRLAGKGMGAKMAMGSVLWLDVGVVHDV
jgi:hypothetical protein